MSQVNFMLILPTTTTTTTTNKKKQARSIGTCGRTTISGISGIVDLAHLRHGGAQCGQLVRGGLAQIRPGPGLPHTLPLHSQNIMDGLQRGVH